MYHHLPIQACGAWDAGACPWRWLDFAKATRHIHCMHWAHICKMTPSVTLEFLFPPGETSEPEGNEPKTWNEQIHPHLLSVQPAICPKNQMLDQSIHNDFLRAMPQQSILIYGYKTQYINLAAYPLGLYICSDFTALSPYLLLDLILLASFTASG